MAKGKHSVALFEVIQSRKASRQGMSLRTPKWWFKRRPPGTPATANAEVHASEPETVVKQTVPPAECTAPAPRVPGIDLKMDPQHQRINFNMSYTSAGIAAFTVIVAVGLAYLIGQRMQRGPASAMAGPTSEQIRNGPINRSVLDIPSKPQAAPAPIKRAAASQAPLSGAERPPALTAPTSAESTAANALSKRVIGMQYVIMQSYRDEKQADDARDLLIKNGIACTVERGNGVWASKDKFQVIGLRGFDHPKGPDLDQYRASIIGLNASLTKSQKFMNFDPYVVGWREQPPSAGQ